MDFELGGIYMLYTGPELSGVLFKQVSLCKRPAWNESDSFSGDNAI